MVENLDTTNVVSKNKNIKFWPKFILLAIIGVYALFIVNVVNVEDGLGKWFPIFLANIVLFIVTLLFSAKINEKAVLLQEILNLVLTVQILFKILWLATGIYWLIIK